MKTKKTKTKAEPSAANPQATKKRASKKMIDDFFLKLSPQVQKQIDQLKGAFEKNPARVETMKVLGLKILDRAKEFSQAIKAEKLATKMKLPRLRKAKSKATTTKTSTKKKASGASSEKKS